MFASGSAPRWGAAISGQLGQAGIPYLVRQSRGTLVRPEAQRLGRFLLAPTVAYALAVPLRAEPAARHVGHDCEILRTTPRPGTRCRLSAVSLGILPLSFARFAALAVRALTRLLVALARGTAAATLAVCPP